MTNDGNGVVSGFLDGVFQSFSSSTASMDFSAFPGNPDRLIHFFADNTQGGGQGEFADGSVALIRLYDIELTSDEMSTLPPTQSVPEPTIITLMGLGMIGIGLGRRKKQS
ncbi:MAG: PEP-CTERM sorting domain-containing protein [Gammaproteobacteria bacterium]|nr:PEP-CTERM sorting domain-containing protein [Gammaproteobacteria bacterium]